MDQGHKQTNRALLGDWPKGGERIMDQPRITRFEPRGPADTGMQEWDAIDPAGLEAGTPVQSGHLYHQVEASGYMAGVWDCTPMTEKFGPYAVHEFMFLLEGSITMILADGTEVTVNAGDPFVVPKGLPCQWKQEGYVRKYFMIFEDPGARTADDVSSQGIILPQPSGPSGAMEIEAIDDPSGYIGDLPTQRKHTYFEDPSGQMIVGVWDSTPFERAVAPFPRNELMCLLEGSVTLTDGDGKEHHFQAGDAIYVPKGAPCGWKNTEYIRKYYAIFEPSRADAASAGAAQ